MDVGAGTTDVGVGFGGYHKELAASRASALRSYLKLFLLANSLFFHASCARHEVASKQMLQTYAVLHTNNIQYPVTKL